MKTLVAGPWLGEFGWELMMWQARLRHLALKNNYKNIICLVRTGHEYLYSDFTNEFLFMDMAGIKNGWKINNKNPIIPQPVIEQMKKKHGDVCIYSPGEKFDFSAQKFIKYHVDSNKKYDLVFHCRQTTNMGTGYRNWPIVKWNELKNNFSGLKIACIGNPREAMAINGTDNYLGVSIKRTIEILSNAKIIIGPSSGPMHLASLCGCTHIVFTGKGQCFGTQTNRCRYETGWNPLKTKAIVLDQEGWNPSVKYVSDVIEKEIKNV